MKTSMCLSIVVHSKEGIADIREDIIEMIMPFVLMGDMAMMGCKIHGRYFIISYIPKACVIFVSEYGSREELDLNLPIIQNLLDSSVEWEGFNDMSKETNPIVKTATQKR